MFALTSWAPSARMGQGTTWAVFAALLAIASAPAVAAGDDSICTDRPGKGNNACTVLAGKVQLETDLVNWTRQTDGGVRTDTILYTNPTLKLGLTSSADLQLNIAPYEEVLTHRGPATSPMRAIPARHPARRLSRPGAGTSGSAIPPAPSGNIRPTR